MDLLLLESNIGLFLGRFHPLLVHLPIGFILLAFLLQLLSRKSPSPGMDKAIVFSLGIGALGAVFAAGAGWLLANEGGYDDKTLFLHRWMGIGLAILATVGWAMKSGRWSVRPLVFNSTLVGCVALMLFGGHLGGNLTHGEQYLWEYAPAPIAALAGHAQAMDVEEPTAFNNPDSTLVYTHIIQPVMENKCVECHNENKTKGGLLMTSVEALQKGGAGGPVLVSGNAKDSEMFKRITLPHSSRKYMPTDGRPPLDYKEIQLIKWWIDEGASFEAALSAMDIPRHIKEILEDDYQISTTQKSYVETAEVPQIDASSLQALKAQGYTVSRIAANNNFLDVSLPPGKAMSKEQLEVLLKAKNQLTWLNLSRSGLLNDHLEIINQLPHLSRLNISQNAIDDEGFQKLQNLEKLEYLNLYGTRVTDASMQDFSRFPQLRRLYVWQTEVSEAALESLREKWPDLDVQAGLSFAQKEASAEE